MTANRVTQSHAIPPIPPETERNMQPLVPSEPSPDPAQQAANLDGLIVTESSMEEWDTCFGEFQDAEEQSSAPSSASF
jgi:hypothetical protein